MQVCRFVTSINRYAILQKRIASNNALSTDVEEAQNLKRHIEDLKGKDILPADKLEIVKQKFDGSALFQYK